MFIILKKLCLARINSKNLLNMLFLDHHILLCTYDKKVIFNKI